MTESGEKWAGEKVLQCAGIFGYPIHSLEKTAEFWLRAFCNDLSRRADSVQLTSRASRLLAAFEEIKHEFGID